MAEKPQRPRRVGGGTVEGTGVERQADATRGGQAGDGPTMLMDEVVRRENMTAAQARVVKNKGSAGVDGMTVDELLPYCCEHWERIRKELLDGTYRPQPVRQVEIPKPDGGVRQLGIPTVVDRMIQQAVLQVLNPLFDPLFSESSFGFRPGRGTHDAVRSARSHRRRASMGCGPRP